MASSSTTLISSSSSSTRILLPAKFSLPSLSLSFLPTLSSPSALASLRFARPSSLTSIRSTSSRSFARPFVVVSLNVELILDETNGEHHVKMRWFSFSCSLWRPREASIDHLPRCSIKLLVLLPRTVSLP
ncbi:BnaCnng15070D [Brassica napus]|uniref:BnaCnng15070D protein n=2 Tax=Brassica TaxID=3705 RepID=A0A078IDY3_BRANA|nr:BnaCnng15070D [Brassica napus]VDC97287.1 unnamed protein product [Brassica oleracea]